MRKRALRIAATSAVVLGTVSLAACGGTRSGSAAESSGDVKTDFGVTEDTITLGVLSDFSVVYGPLAKTVYAGNKIWADEVNEDGGICGRQIKLDVQDQKMDTQLANTQYAAMKSNVLGIVQLLGSPVISSLLPQLKADHMPTMANGWSAGYLGTPELAFIGTSYDLDEINGLQYLVDEGKLKAGDTIGHIYMAGDFGENAAEGAKFAAGKLGLKHVGKKVDSTATDISAEMAALKAANVKAVLVSTGPKQTAMVASQAPSLGLTGPILVNAPSYDPSFLKSPAAEEVLKNLLVVTSQAPYTGDSEAQKRIAAAFPGVADGAAPTHHVMAGYENGKILGAAMEAACEDGDLTRQSVVEHMRELKDFDADGLFPTQDFTDPAKAGSRESLILKADTNDGGLSLVKDYFASPLQDEYRG